MTISNLRIIAGLSFLISTAVQAGPNLVVNPGFETGTLGPWATNGGSFFIDSTSGDVHTGSFAVSNLSCAFGCNDTLSQVLSTTPSGTYNLSFFAFTKNVNNGNPLVTVSWGGTTVFNQNIPTSNPGLYQQFSVDGLIAPSGSTTLQFAIAPAAHLLLDDVSVTSPVPVPPAIWLLGSAVGGLRMLRRRVDS